MKPQKPKNKKQNKNKKPQKEGVFYFRGDASFEVFGC